MMFDLLSDSVYRRQGAEAVLSFRTLRGRERKTVSALVSFRWSV